MPERLSLAVRTIRPGIDIRTRVALLSLAACMLFPSLLAQSHRFVAWFSHYSHPIIEDYSIILRRLSSGDQSSFSS
jgi:hypothetical protein